MSFWLAGTADACDDLDIGGSIQFDDSIQVLCSRDRFHIATTFKNENILCFWNYLLRLLYSHKPVYAIKAFSKLIKFYFFESEIMLQVYLSASPSPISTHPSLSMLSAAGRPPGYGGSFWFLLGWRFYQGHPPGERCLLLSYIFSPLIDELRCYYL